MPLNGTSLVQAARRLVQTEDLAKQSQHVDRQTVVAAPANAVQTELLSFQVPDGMYFRLSAILLTYVGIPIQDQTQLVTWVLDVNRPITTLVAPAIPSGYPVRDYQAVTTHRGSLDFGPWPIGREQGFEGGAHFDPNDVLRIKVKTTNPFPGVGSPVFFVSGIQGRVYPKERPL